MKGPTFRNAVTSSGNSQFNFSHAEHPCAPVINVAAPAYRMMCPPCDGNPSARLSLRVLGLRMDSASAQVHYSVAEARVPPKASPQPRSDPGIPLPGSPFIGQCLRWLSEGLQAPTQQTCVEGRLAARRATATLGAPADQGARTGPRRPGRSTRHPQLAGNVLIMNCPDCSRWLFAKRFAVIRFWIKDFHLQAVDHARHTRKRPREIEAFL